MSEILLIHKDLTYCIFREAVDMRKQFDGLSGVVLKFLKKNVAEERTVFFFFNKRRTHVKALLCEKTGMTIFYRRLHNGVFELPGFEPGQPTIDLEPVMIASLLQGLCLHRPANK